MPEQDANTAEVMRKLSESMVPFSRTAKMDDNTRALASEMSANRKVAARKVGAASINSPGSVQFATGRPRDPLFYWKQNNLPYDYGRGDELKRIREYTRLLYVSHSLIGSCVDIYSKYPLLGMHPQSKDSQIEDFYGALFFDEDRLNYDEFTVDMGREYWTAGEAWPLGTFNEPLGIWDSEELLHPDDVEVQQSPFLRDPRFFIRLPESIRTLIETRSPAWEYAKLVETYPELVAYSSRDELMPVSSVLLRQYKFKADTFNKRGIPLLMRAMRPIMQEEMLNAAMDAIADRMYTPLVVARLGASASDVGLSTPWIPTAGEREEFMESLDVALAADFRVLVTNFMTQIESVFGRENMPDFSADFERVEGRILQTFGLSQTMLSGASSGQTYAADALNRDLVSQLLTKYQKMIASHFRQRALVVAEAQEHYDYEERGGKKYVKMEEILEVDEETGEQRIVEQPKLLVPELKFKCTTPETPVLTPNGYVRADSLTVGSDVIAWDVEGDCAAVSRVSYSGSNGTKPVLAVKTRLGRVLRATDNHPYLTDRGWVLAKDLTVGDRLRVGTDIPETADAGGCDSDTAYLLGVLVGDGGLTGHDVRFTTGDVEIVQAVSAYVDRYDCEVVHASRYDWRIVKKSRTKGAPNPVKVLAKEYGLWGHGSAAKRIPAAVWSGGPKIWASFLSGYLDADATVNPNRLVSWGSCNRPLMEDTQALLSALGVRSSINSVWNTEYRRDYYRLEVTTKKGLSALQEILASVLPRKQQIWTEGSLVHAGRRLSVDQIALIHRMREEGATYDQIVAATGVSRSVVARAATGHYDTDTSQSMTPDWDRIESIESLGECETWALTVDEYHTHVTGGLVTHNTMNLQDEEAQRQFLEQLREAGVPVSVRTRVQATGLNFDEEIERTSDETVQLAVAEQETRKETYLALRAKGLPMPQDLLDDFEPKANTTAADAAVSDGRAPLLGTDPTVDTPYLAPTQGDLEAIPAPGAVIPGQQTQPVDPVAMQQAAIDAANAQVPPESNEMRAEMPKAAALYRSASRMREIADKHYVKPVGAFGYVDDSGARQIALTGEPSGMYAAPRHIGMRRFASHVQYALKHVPMDTWGNPALNTIPPRPAAPVGAEESRQRDA